MDNEIPTLIPLEEFNPSKEVKEPPNRNYEQALANDGLVTLRKIVELYTPNFTEKDVSGLREAFKFALENPEPFDSATLNNEAYDKLPDYVKNIITK